MRLSALVVLFAVVLGWAKPAHADSEWPTQIALGTFLVTGFIDTAQTAHCLGQGTCRESNPLMRPLMGRSVALTAAVKGASAVGITYALLKARHRYPRVVWWTAMGMAAVQTLIVVHNVRTIP